MRFYCYYFHHKVFCAVNANIFQQACQKQHCLLKIYGHGILDSVVQRLLCSTAFKDLENISIMSLSAQLTITATEINSVLQ